MKKISLLILFFCCLLTAPTFVDAATKKHVNFASGDPLKEELYLEGIFRHWGGDGSGLPAGYYQVLTNLYDRSEVRYLYDGYTYYPVIFGSHFGGYISFYYGFANISGYLE